MTKGKSLLVLAALAMLCVRISMAQVTTGTILGTVKDSTGAVIPGATVVLLNQDTGISRTVQGDAAGHYSATTLSLGNYRVTATAPGFQTEVRSGIVLTVGQTALIDLSLSVGTVSQTVEVAGEAPTVETANATISGLVSETQIRDLPLNGRSYADLALLTPGVIYNRTTGSDASTGFGQRLSVNGARGDANLYLIDGMVANDAADNTASVAQLSLGVEGIREFRVLTHNFSAEYGRNSGSVVSVVTRSGTNQFHGSLYEFVRNNIFDARDFFTKGPVAPFRRNQFGAAAGGPVKKDRIFFFANYEGLRQRLASPIVSFVPDVNARQGILPQGNVTVNPAVVPYINLYPLPNDRNVGGGVAIWTTNFSAPTTEDYSLQRMDFRLGDKDNFYFRYIYDPATGNIPRPIPNFVSENVTTNHYATVGETHIFSGSALNDFRFAFNRTLSASINSSSVSTSSLAFVPGQASMGDIQYSVAGSANSSGTLSELGSSPPLPFSFLLTMFQANDSFSLVRGPHSLKFGFDIERNQFNSLYGKNWLGVFTFPTIQAFLTGTPSLLNGAVIGGNSSRHTGYRQILFGWFVQDDYRITSRLTLNIGLRHEFYNDPSEVNGRSASLVNVTDPTSTLGPPFHTSKLNFAPRVGLAWDPTGSGKTAVRLGAGVFYNQVGTRTWQRLASSDTRFYSGYSVKNPTTFPLVPANPPLKTGGSELTVENQMATPTIIQYSLDVQKQLPHSLSARLGFVGSHGYNETFIADPDVVIATILPNGAKFYPLNGPTVNPNFSSIEQLRTGAMSNYDAFQASLQKSLSAGLMFGAIYVYSKGLSEADNAANRQTDNNGAYVVSDYTNLGMDYGRSSYDQRNTFVFNSQYRMPWDHLLTNKIEKAALGGWEINGIFQYGSGMPLNINMGFNSTQSNDQNQPDRPSVLPGGTNNPVNGVTAGCAGIPAGQKLRTPTLWFDPCAFAIPTLGTFGNLGRDTVSGPTFKDVNITLVKHTAITERVQLEFRAEFFNVLNHPSFALPNLQVFQDTTGLHAGNEGTINATVSSGRQMQLGMRLTF